MTTIAYSSVNIQTSAQSVSSIPPLVRGGHSPGTPTESREDSGTHQRAGALDPSSLRSL